METTNTLPPRTGCLRAGKSLIVLALVLDMAQWILGMFQISFVWEVVPVGSMVTGLLMACGFAIAARYPNSWLKRGFKLLALVTLISRLLFWLVVRAVDWYFDYSYGFACDIVLSLAMGYFMVLGYRHLGEAAGLRTWNGLMALTLCTAFATFVTVSRSLCVWFMVETAHEVNFIVMPAGNVMMCFVLYVMQREWRTFLATPTPLEEDREPSYTAWGWSGAGRMTAAYTVASLAFLALFAAFAHFFYSSI